MRFLLSVTALLVSIPTLAAVPPRSTEALKAGASDIVVGTVRAVYSADVTVRAGFVDHQYVYEVVVTTVEKGEGAKAGQVIYAKAWKPAERPRGWAGPQGQNEVPAAGAAGRLYLTRADDGTLSVMTPNGWDATKP